MASSSKTFTSKEAFEMIIGEDDPVVERPAEKIMATERKHASKSATGKDASKNPSRFYGARKCITLSEASEEVETTNASVRNVTILPPATGDGYLTDEEEDFDDVESLPQEVVGTLEVNFETDDDNDECNINQQVPSTSESVQPLAAKRTRKKIVETIDYSSEEDEILQSKKGKNVGPKKQKKKMIGTSSEGKEDPKKKKSGKKEKPSYKWTKNPNTFKPLKRNGSVDGYSKVGHLEGQSPFDIWSLLFTPDMVEHITNQTMLYASREKGDHNFYVMSDEIYKFLGIIIFSGYHHVPSERDFWSTQPDLQVPFISREMPRNRYLKIKQYLHLADNHNLEEGDKVAKVKPIYDAFNQNLKQFGLLHSKLAVDESMVPYKGLHSIRQYMKSKPIKFGYKLWALCGVDGYTYHLDIYCGKSEENHGRFGLGGNVVLSMVDIANDMGEKDIEFFFDNYFSSNELLVHLTQQKVLATGTVKANRTGGADLILLEKKLMEKETRGAYDSTCTKDVFITSWNDNSVVQVISNCHQVTPLHTVLRRVRGKGEIPVKQPNSVQEYNVGMGGVDQLDRLLQSYRPKIQVSFYFYGSFCIL